MADFKLPYVAEFSPDKIKIKDILRMASANEGDTAENLVTEIAKKYFKRINQWHQIARILWSRMIFFKLVEVLS